VDKVDRFSGSLSWLQPILWGKNPEKSRVTGYSKLNKMEESPNFAKGGVEKKKRFLEVIYKKESLCKHLRKTRCR